MEINKMDEIELRQQNLNVKIANLEEKMIELLEKNIELSMKYIKEVSEHSETLEDLAIAKKMIQGMQSTINHLEDAIMVDTEKESKINDLSDSEEDEVEEPEKNSFQEAVDKFIVPLVPMVGKLLETYLERMNIDAGTYQRPKEETRSEEFKIFLDKIFERKKQNKEESKEEPCDNCGSHHGSVMIIHNKKTDATIIYDKTNKVSFEFKEKKSDDTRDIAFCNAGDCCRPGLFRLIEHMNNHPDIMNNEELASNLIGDIVEFARSGKHFDTCKKAKEEIHLANFPDNYLKECVINPE